jgi:glycosyltransferase involved in cell wall biosynthesis
MWRLIYDARAVAQEHTGLGRYTASLLLGLLESSRAQDCQVDVLFNRTEATQNAHVVRIEEAIARRGGACSHNVPVPAISIRQHWEMSKWVHPMGGDHYFYPHFDCPIGVRIPSTFVVHDVIPLKVEGYVQSAVWAKKLYFKELICWNVARAERCIAVSATTRDDVIDLVGARHSQKVDVVFEGSLISPSRSDQDALVQEPYLLYVGDRRPHKNIQRVIDLFVALKEQHDYAGVLVLVGSRLNYGFDVEQYIAGRTDVIIAGNVSDEALAWYYQHTDGLVFLSAYEGFGLPVIEAATFNRRIIVSDGGSLAEIAPPSACVVARDMPISAAAPKVAAYLRGSTDINLPAYLDQFAWTSAARHIFPKAYPAV